MEQQNFTRIALSIVTAVLCLGMFFTHLAAQEAPVVEVTSDAEAGAEAVETEVEEIAPEVETAEEAVVETETSASEMDERTGANAVSSEVSTYKPQGEWDLNVSLDSDVRIRKIYEFLNDPKVTKTGKDRSLEYEFKYFNHGAITKGQRYNREGQYYVVTWTNRGAPADYQLRIDYRQSKTRDKINTITIPYPAAEGTYKGTFSITGDHYYLNGSILSWRISVVRDGVIVAEDKSFVW